MRVLIYKRTHKGDPDEKGIFGNQDCMGRIRNWNYDAVIGIGGKTSYKGQENIRYRINWVGLGPKRFKSNSKRGDYVLFSHIEVYEENGEEIQHNYPSLFNHMYNSRKRFDMSSKLPENVYHEVKKIVDSVKNSPPSQYLTIDPHIWIPELDHNINHLNDTSNNCDEATGNKYTCSNKSC